MSANAADEAKRMSRLHQAWIVDTLESHGGSCTYGKLVEVGEEHQCDTVGSMIKYLKSKKVSTCWQVRCFLPPPSSSSPLAAFRAIVAASFALF